MDWQNAIAGIDYTRPENDPKRGWTSSDPSVFASALGLDFWEGWNSVFDSRVKKFWIASWICTDTRVGLACYVMDGSPVAVSRQSARKSEEVIEFLTLEDVERMRALILSLMEEDRKSPPLCDLNEELDVSWFVRAETEKKR